MPDSDVDGKSSNVRPRRNVVASNRRSFRKRFESIGYLLLLLVILVLVVWFLATSIGGNSDARDAEATTVATLFAPETAVAKELTETAQQE